MGNLPQPPGRDEVRGGDYGPQTIERILVYINALNQLLGPILNGLNVNTGASVVGQSSSIQLPNTGNFQVGDFVAVNDIAGSIFRADSGTRQATHVVTEANASTITCASNWHGIITTGSGTGREVYLGSNGRGSLSPPNPSDDNTNILQVVGARLQNPVAGRAFCVVNVSNAVVRI